MSVLLNNLVVMITVTVIVTIIVGVSIIVIEITAILLKFVVLEGMMLMMRPSVSTRTTTVVMRVMLVRGEGYLEDNSYENQDNYHE
jgi:hypothetical protein